MNLELFTRYYRSLKLFNFARNYLPNAYRATDDQTNMLGDEYEFELRAQSTGIDTGEFRALLRKYLKPKTRNKLDWRQAVETRSK